MKYQFTSFSNDFTVRQFLDASRKLNLQWIEQSHPRTACQHVQNEM
jgi:hypothetical protein